MAGVQVRINATGYARFISGAVQPYLMKKGREIAQEAINRAPQNTGALKESITVTPHIGGGATVKVSAPYAGFVETGTGPAAGRPQYYPKLRRSGLILWAESKGANPYAVARGISRSGTQPNPFFEQSVEAVLRKYQFKWINRTITNA